MKKFLSIHTILLYLIILFLVLTSEDKITSNDYYGYEYSTSDSYNRKDWKHWINADGDCQNTRQKVLIRQGEDIQLTPNGCKVKSGYWIDPYSGKSYTDPNELEIDHIIPLKWAHFNGGADWRKKEKKKFANDLSNLVAIGKNLNREKGSKGPNQWLPPLSRFRCQYLNSWIAVFENYTSLEWKVVFNKYTPVNRYYQIYC